MKRIHPEMIQLYRDVFLRTPDGRDVLMDLMNDLYGWANKIETDEQRILHNAALMIMAKLGVQLPGQVPEILESWARIPVPKEQNDNGRDDE